MKFDNPGQFNIWNGLNPHIIIAAGLTEADLLHHQLDISAFVPENCVAVILSWERTFGGGTLQVFSNESFRPQSMTFTSDMAFIGIRLQRIEYRFTQANDVGDLHLTDYITRGY